MVFTGSDSPVVVVLSGSMEPAYQRGDILFLWLGDDSDPIRMGEVCVFKLKGRDIPIVHRVLEVHNRCEICISLCIAFLNCTFTLAVYHIPPFALAHVCIVAVASILRLSDDGRQELLTKGDNNAVDDRALYNRGQMWLTRENIVGRARGYVYCDNHDSWSRLVIMYIISTFATRRCSDCIYMIFCILFCTYSSSESFPSRADSCRMWAWSPSC